MRHLPAQLLPLAALEPRQHALDHAADLDRVERLDDVADAADLLAGLTVLEADPRRQENDRDIAGLLVPRRRRATSQPSMPGIITSSRIRSGRSLRASSIPFVPSSASSTSMPDA